MSRFHFTLILLALLWLIRLVPGLSSLPQWIPIPATALAFGFVAAGSAFPCLNFFGEFVNRAATQRKALALTFDDGPNPDTTPALLDFLKSAGIQAAFFCIGSKAAKYPELIRRMFKEGHIVGNHSMAHHHATNLFSPARLRNDIEAAQAAIRAATGANPVFFRPPMGLSNPRLFPVLKKLNLQPVGWTTRAFDRSTSKPETVAARLARGIRPGAILLLHDGVMPKETMARTLRLLLDKLASRGYQIERLDMLLK